MPICGRTIVAGALALGAVIGWPTPAAADTALVASSPPAGTVLHVAPTRVTATLDQPVGSFATLTVVGPDSYTWTTGQVEVSGSQLSAPLMPLRHVGGYTARYRALTVDGNEVAGSWSFMVSAPELAGL
ncbi:copper resistance CopC family protein [Mycolicibacterium confluentis]|uniref:CopC domain-containing protein n=1 Tax=Mycolicibacterium confluentis TaxID=28047 RepID=A0A7I7XZ88_9MYCO|nr:copper resistance CopC family protein [Mycolicibacterium confluentis]MCV7319646.1 copper resistance protein CopC [Mycolicibacterium confluentis]BBZ34670.1 hypothetical protein MCNF_32750 [Mycolicibacterium confluentis]